MYTPHITMIRVFISYSKRDSKQAKIIENLFEYESVIEISARYPCL